MIHFRSANGETEIIVSSAFAGAGAGYQVPDSPLSKGMKLPDGTFFTEGFETGGIGWTTEGVPAGSWEIGAPTAGPKAAYEGTNAAAVKLAGGYPNSVDKRLVSPAIDLRRISADDLYNANKRIIMHVRSWFSTMPYKYDCGWVLLAPTHGDDLVLSPAGGYPEKPAPCNYSLPHVAYAGDLSGKGWSDQVFDLTPYAGLQFNLKFQFVSYDYTSYYGSFPGWFIDAITVALADA